MIRYNAGIVIFNAIFIKSMINIINKIQWDGTLKNISLGLFFQCLLESMPRTKHETLKMEMYYWRIMFCALFQKKRPTRLHIKPSITLTWIWLTRYLYNMCIHWWYLNCSDLQLSYYISYQKFEDGCIVNPIHMRFIKHN